MRSWPRAVTITVVVVVAMVLALAATLLILIQSERRATIEIDLQLAQPFLALDDSATLEKEYGSAFPDGLGSGPRADHCEPRPASRPPLTSR